MLRPRVWWKAGDLGLQSSQKLSSASVPQVGGGDPKPLVPLSTLDTPLLSVFHLIHLMTWKE